MNTIGIEKVGINGLFGKKNILLDFSSKVKIIVGENGLGKTTILNILNELFNGRPESIINYPIESVTFKFRSLSDEFKFFREDMKRYQEMKKRVLEDLEEEGVEELLHQIMETSDMSLLDWDSIQLETFIRGILRNNPLLEDKLLPFGVMPDKLIAEWISEFPSVFFFKSIIKKEDFRLKFLPTYRRIETDLTKVVSSQNNIFISNRRAGKPRNSMSIPTTESLGQIFSDNSLMRFGMKDVSKSIDDILKRISNKVVKGYNEVSTKMVSHLLDFKDKNIAPKKKIVSEQLRVILERLGESMSENERQQLNNVIENGEAESNEHLNYYLGALLDVYKSTEELDSRLNSFCSVINQFLYDKKFFYDESHIKFNLYFNTDSLHSNPVSLENLSSGEKQLVSLFAYAFLSNNKKVVYIIDEPELSLSLTWQRLLLPSLKNAPTTALIIAATHSPFIFDNELKNDTIGGAEYAFEISK